MRTSLPEKDIVASDNYNKDTGKRTLKLFSDVTSAGGTSLEFKRELTDSELHYRYRTVESTIPVRNNFL